MPKASVIIPIYGVEKYIERCVRSLFEQTLDDIEYLFIDDCSPDGSVRIIMRILDEYPNRKEQVIIHRMEQNSGQAKVREWGMKNATGDYVIHCDSDDWTDLMMYESMYQKALEEDADVVVCDYYKSDGVNHEMKLAIASGTDILSLLSDILRKMISAAVWNKLVRRNLYLITNFLYPTNDMGEDMVIMTQILLSARNVSYINRPYYFYFCNPTSICNATPVDAQLKRFIQAVNNAKLIKTIFAKSEYFLRLRHSLNKYFFEERYLLVPLIKVDKKYITIWKNTFPEINRYVLLNPYLTFGNKAHFYLTLFKSYL